MWYTTINAKHNVFKQGVHYMTSPFGMRTLNGITSFHNGVDIIGNHWACDHIVAFANGKVTDMLNTCSGNFPATGNYVVIEHGNGIKTVYYHMALGSVAVKIGQAVKAGDVLGYMGTTGNSTGNHLHFGIMINGVWVDPLPYLKGEKDMLGFKDVPETHWAYKAIESLADMGIIKGYEDGTFKPESYLTRIEAIVALVRTHKEYDENTQYAPPPFVDVPTNAWYINYLGFAYQKGIAKGYEDGTFKPDNYMTRAEFAVVVDRFISNK